MTNCPICVQLQDRAEYARHRRYTRTGEWKPWRLPKVKAATHGAGGPSWAWSACLEHYEVITAFEWLRMTHKFDIPGDAS